MSCSAWNEFKWPTESAKQTRARLSKAVVCGGAGPRNCGCGPCFGTLLRNLLDRSPCATVLGFTVWLSISLIGARRGCAYDAA